MGGGPAAVVAAAVDTRHEAAGMLDAVTGTAYWLAWATSVARKRWVGHTNRGGAQALKGAGSTAKAAERTVNGYLGAEAAGTDTVIVAAAGIAAVASRTPVGMGWHTVAGRRLMAAGTH